MEKLFKNEQWTPMTDQFVSGLKYQVELREGRDLFEYLCMIAFILVILPQVNVDAGSNI